MKKLYCVALFMLMTICFTSCGNVGDDEQTAIVPKPLPENNVAVNPYMANSDNSMHFDNYNSDVTDQVVPLGINSDLSTVVENTNPIARSFAIYDIYGNAIMPYLGGLSIANLNDDAVVHLGSFIPSRDDTEDFAIQTSYAFVDANNNIIAPTSHGYIYVLKTMNEEGEILPVSEKLAEVNVVEAAKEQLGEDIDTRLLSIMYDYEGNLWFVTGGFQIDPTRNPAGFMGYISSEYMQSLTTGKQLSEEEHVYTYRLNDGESAENGIATNEDGAVILTNSACYMLTAENGVNVVWETSYDSNGINFPDDGGKYEGSGFAWGGGSSPTLTSDLVLFTDNLDPVNLIAISSKTGEIVAQSPVLDGLEEDIPVSVENSIVVYSVDENSTSVIITNWFGAGNAGLADPDADSSIQSYSNLYDPNWTEGGNEFIAPGIERVDIIKNEEGYSAEKVWFREDVSDTSMLRLSTATGYIYGYCQDLETDMWGFEVLDFDTGETVLRKDVSSVPGYNNMAVGVFPGTVGNGIYCPTNIMEIVRWQDDFVYLPDSPAKQISLHNMERYYIRADEFADKSQTKLEPKTYLMKATIKNLPEETNIAFLANGLNETVSDYTLFYQNEDGNLSKLDSQWSIYDSSGKKLDQNDKLVESEIYEIRLPIVDQGKVDLNDEDGFVEVGIILGK